MKCEESKPTWISNDKELAVYKAENGLKLSELNFMQESELINFIGAWNVDLGIVAELTPHELNYIEKWLIESYPEMTIEKLVNMKKLSLTRQLNVNPVPYGKLSPLYIGGIIEAYKEYEEDIMHVILKRKHDSEKAKTEELKKITPIESRKEYLIYYFNRVKNEDSYFTDLKEIGWGVSSRIYYESNIESMIEPYYLDAVKITEKENLKKRNQFEKALPVDEVDLLKIQKWLFIKNYLKSLNVEHLVNGLTEYQLMGE